MGIFTGKDLASGSPSLKLFIGGNRNAVKRRSLVWRSVLGATQLGRQRLELIEAVVNDDG